jgi:hypothetical protein
MLFILLLTGCSNTLYIEYLDKKIDVSNYEYLDTSKSSFVTGAWFNSYSDQIVIGLNEVHYLYCYVPETVWNEFKETPSFGSYYNANIKGEYSCSPDSAYMKEMKARSDQCWLNDIEMEDVIEILKSEGWKKVEPDLWSSPDGEHMITDFFYETDAAMDAFDRVYENCMYDF